jgi:hypothetical protein
MSHSLRDFIIERRDFATFPYPAIKRLIRFFSTPKNSS